MDERDQNLQLKTLSGLGFYAVIVAILIWHIQQDHNNNDHVFEHSMEPSIVQEQHLQGETSPPTEAFALSHVALPPPPQLRVPQITTPQTSIAQKRAPSTMTVSSVLPASNAANPLPPAHSSNSEQTEVKPKVESNYPKEIATEVKKYPLDVERFTAKHEIKNSTVISALQPKTRESPIAIPAALQPKTRENQISIPAALQPKPRSSAAFPLKSSAESPHPLPDSDENHDSETPVHFTGHLDKSGDIQAEQSDHRAMGAASNGTQVMDSDGETGAIALRLIEHGQGPDIQIMWPADISQREEVWTRLTQCMGMIIARLSPNGKLYRLKDPAGQSWSVETDIWSGFMRQADQPATRDEAGLWQAIDGRHGLSRSVQSVRLFPRHMDSVFLGGLSRHIGQPLNQVSHVSAAYTARQNGVLLTDIRINGTDIPGHVWLISPHGCP